MGLGLLYGGLKLSPGDEVLTSEHDHYSTHSSLEDASLLNEPGDVVHTIQALTQIARGRRSAAL